MNGLLLILLLFSTNVLSAACVKPDQCGDYANNLSIFTTETKIKIFKYIFKILDKISDFILTHIFGEPPENANGNPTRTSYKNFQFIRLWPKSDEIIEDISSLSEEEPSIQLWTYPKRNQSTEIIMPSDLAEEFEQNLKQRNVLFTILNQNLEEAISKQNPKNLTEEQKNVLRNTNGHPLTFTSYHPLEDIDEYLSFLEKTYKAHVEVITIGQSFENRELKVVRIYAASVQPDDANLRPAIWIDAGMHGQEWISTAVALYIIRQLAERFKQFKSLLLHFDWYIMPVANPDGYVYTYGADRLWKKSKSINQNAISRLFWSGKNCLGVNLSNNWDYNWSDDGVKGDPCHESYAGKAPFSEPETRAISEFILDNKSQIKGGSIFAGFIRGTHYLLQIRDRLMLYLTLHAYSQTWMMPWSYAKSRGPEYDDLLYLGKTAVESIRRGHRAEYEMASSPTLMHPTTGSSDDWAKQKAGIKYSYTVELPDKGSNGYLLPANQIVPTGKEIFTAVRTVAKTIANSLNKKDQEGHDASLHIVK